MSIELTPALESLVQSEAKRANVSVNEWVNRILSERLGARNGAASPESLDADDAPMSAQELEAERRIYAEIEKNGIPRVRI